MLTPPAASLALDQREGLPEALRVLATAYPRAIWDSHENFGELVQFWMQRHVMFRRLVELLRMDAESAIIGDLDLKTYGQRLSRYCGTLIHELHGHHHIEDHHYFPKLTLLDARVARGFDLLEADHTAMDGLLQSTADAANVALRGGEIGSFHTHLERFSTLLERHLTDEEDIVVPVILHSGFRG